MPPKPKQIYQFKVTLKYSKPPIWRRILVHPNVRLDQMHRILQVVMGWMGGHLHQFIIDGDYYGESHDDYDDFLDMKDHRKFRLSDFQMGVGTKFIYEYDFGDSWEHILLLEKILTPEAGFQYPTCIKGKRACPPEDVGGIWGYEEFLEAIADPEHEMHIDYTDWIGDDFDPEEFDLNDINQGLKYLKL
jgi:hypothetical protein